MKMQIQTGKEHEELAAATGDSNNRSHWFTITEVCPHCESEIEMRWNTGIMGFKAFCPVCGKRLMLCDECRHCKTCGPCEYDRETDSCQRNEIKREEESRPEAGNEDQPESLELPVALGVDTPLGTIVVKTAVDAEHPGIYLDLRRSDSKYDIPLVVVEFSADDVDRPEGEQNIITRIWGNANQEGYTNRVIHEGIENFFRAEEPEDDEDDYLVLSTPDIAVQMLADLKGKLCSDYFVIAQGRKHPENKVSIALSDYVAKMNSENNYYTVYMVDDAKPFDCQLFHTDSSSEKSLMKLLEEILENLRQSNRAGDRKGSTAASVDVEAKCSFR